MKDRTLVIIIAIVAVVAGVYVWTQMEYYEEEVYLGQSVAARLNPYLAAERYLQQVGVDVESAYQIDDGDNTSPNATLFIANANHVLSERQADRLIDWIETGGHIIVAAQLLGDNEDDVFLSRFEVSKYTEYDDDIEFDVDDFTDDEQSVGDRLREANRQFEAEMQREEEKRQAEEEGLLETVSDRLTFEENSHDAERLMTLSFEGYDEELKIYVHENEFLDHPSFYYEEDEEYEGFEPFYYQGLDAGTAFIQFEVGEGLLTILSDSSVWDNDHIGLFDHAFLLQILAGNSAKVIFLRGAQVPNLLDLILKYFFESSVALCLLLLGWLIYRGRRFGPIRVVNDRGRRSYREHLSAVGEFYWRNKRRDQLLTNARTAIWRELNKQFFRGIDETEQNKIIKLAEVSDYSPDYIQSIMHSDAPQDEFKFFQLIKSLQTVRKRL